MLILLGPFVLRSGSHTKGMEGADAEKGIHSNGARNYL